MKNKSNVLAITAFLIALPHQAFGQARDTASLSGSVTDSQAAMVPGAILSPSRVEHEKPRHGVDLVSCRIVVGRRDFIGFARSNRVAVGIRVNFHSAPRVALACLSTRLCELLLFILLNGKNHNAVTFQRGFTDFY